MLVNNTLLKISAVMWLGRTHQLISNSLLSCSSLFRPTSFYRKLTLQEKEQVHYSTRVRMPDNHSHHLKFCTNSSSRKLPVLTLYTKQDCPLCDEALHHLEPFLDQVNHPAHSCFFFFFFNPQTVFTRISNTNNQCWIKTLQASRLLE